MSGGVDSSVAAALLQDQGFDVVGVSMQLSATPAATVREGQGCCSLEDFRDARRVADHLGIPYYVWNLRDAFRERVTRVFTAEYLRGRTPNPCVLCNRDLKFDELWRRAATLGAELVATGHYARVIRDVHVAPDRDLHAAHDWNVRSAHDRDGQSEPRQHLGLGRPDLPLRDADRRRHQL
jgi:tRNA-specific 2-thiouridylase